MKLKEIRQYITLHRLNCNRESFCDEYKKDSEEVLSLLDRASDDKGVYFSSDPETPSNIILSFWEKWEAYWTEVYTFEYNKALMAFEGVECPPRAFISYANYKRLPSFLLEMECALSAPPNKKDFFMDNNFCIITERNALYSFVGFFESMDWRSPSYDKYKLDYEGELAVYACLQFEFDETKELYAEMTTSFYNLFKGYSEYLPESFLDSVRKDKESLEIITGKKY